MRDLIGQEIGILASSSLVPSYHRLTWNQPLLKCPKTAFMFLKLAGGAVSSLGSLILKNSSIFVYTAPFLSMGKIRQNPDFRFLLYEFTLFVNARNLSSIYLVSNLSPLSLHQIKI